MIDLEQIRNHLKDVAEGKVTLKPGQTHLLELFTLMRSGLGDLGTGIETHYTSESLVSKIKFADGKIYELTMREKLWNF